ncbi:MAG: tyrosine-type recombinase/integrase [bacterium]|nr:tyrosine-type recombinase/integrase [bacterium]
MRNNLLKPNHFPNTRETAEILRQLDHLPIIGEDMGIQGYKSDDSSRRVLPDMKQLIIEFGEYLFRKGLAPATFKKYLKDLRQFSKEKAILNLDELTRDSVNDWVFTLRKRNLATGTIADHLWALKHFHKFIEEEKKIALFQWDIRIPIVPAPETVEFLEIAEQETLFTLLDYTKIRDVRLRAFIELMLNTGMRPSEALNLTRAELASRPEEIEIIGKGKKKRSVYLTERVYHWLDQYLSKRNDSHPALFVISNGKEKIRALTLRTMEGDFHHLIQESGTKRKIVLHTLRHTFGTLFMANGCPLDYIARLLGHSNPKTTRKYYLAVTQKHAKEAYIRFNPFDNGNDYKGLPQQSQPVALLLPAN